MKHIIETMTLPLALGSDRRIRCGGKTSGTPPTLVLTTCNLQQCTVKYCKHDTGINTFIETYLLFTTENVSK